MSCLFSSSSNYSRKIKPVVIRPLRSINDFINVPDRMEIVITSWPNFLPQHNKVDFWLYTLLSYKDGGMLTHSRAYRTLATPSLVVWYW